MRYKENIVQRRIQRSNTNQVPILDEETGYLYYNEYLVKYKQLVVTSYPVFCRNILSISVS